MVDLPETLIGAVRATCVLTGRMAGCAYPDCAGTCQSHPKAVTSGWNAALKAAAEQLHILQIQYRQLFKRAEGISKSEAFAEAVEIATSLIANPSDV